MSDDTRKVVLWLVKETPLARLYSTESKACANLGRQVWIPKSQIRHTSKEGFNPQTEWQKHTVEMPEWLLEEKGL